MTKTTSALRAKSRTSWIAPRSGGYRPGGDFAKPSTVTAVSHPPKGGAGVAKPQKTGRETGGC